MQVAVPGGIGNHYCCLEGFKSHKECDLEVSKINKNQRELGLEGVRGPLGQQSHERNKATVGTLK